MKKSTLVTNICLIVLTIASLTFGVFSAVKAKFNATGTIDFYAYNCDVDIQIDIKSVKPNNSESKVGITESTDSTTKITTRTIKLTTISDTSKQHDNFKVGTNAMLVSSWDKSLGKLVFDEVNIDLNKTDVDNRATKGYWLNHIEITISVYNYSGFAIKMSVSEPTSSTSDYTKVAVDIPTTSEYATKYTSGTPTAITKTVTLSGISEYTTELKNIFELSIEPRQMPTKGKLITMDLDGDTTVTGMADTYRVLNITDTTAEVVAMYEASNSQAYWTTNVTTTDTKGNTVTKYDGSDLDKYLNETWYDTLSADAKAAIVENNITQYSYSYGSSGYNATTHASYADYSSKAKVADLTRRVYALDVEDVEEYFGGAGTTAGTFSKADIWKLFWNTTTKPSTATYPWLRSASIDDASSAWCLDGYSGGTTSIEVYDYADAARPAFKIDLAKIDWQEFAEKGDLIQMDLGGSAALAGLANTYRVLKVEGTTAEVVTMFEPTFSQAYWATNTTTTDANGKTVTKYEGSDLDKYINETWYGALSDKAKAAIVANNITQYSYSEGGRSGTHASHEDYSTKAAVGNSFTRNAYALDLADLEIYFGGTDTVAAVFTTTDIWTLLWNTTSAPSTVTQAWFRSANTAADNFAFYVYGGYGDIGGSPTNAWCGVRPAFKIDLSKIDWVIA